MTINVKYFAALRDQSGVDSEVFEVSASTVRDAVDQILIERRIKLPSPMIRIALNGEFVEDNAILHSGDELLLMPPVAGG